MNTFNKNFAAGADVSWLPQMEASGFIFRDTSGNESDCLATLKSYGLNALRLRTWVNPSDNPRSGHCSAPETLALALRAQALGYRIMVDFHYSDSWCDPGKQKKPTAWVGLDFEDLVLAVSEYTLDTLSFFINNGFTPEWVQLGNETNPGMLLPDGSTDNFNKLTRLYNAGYDAVKEASPDTLAIIHLADGNKTELLTHYFDNLTENGCRYDIIGLSYYPYWLKSPYQESINDLGLSLKLLPERYNKDVMLVETGGPSAEEDETCEMLSAVLEQISTAPRCTGFFYWEPQGAQAFSGYPLSAWRDDGTPTGAMDAYLNIVV